MKKLTHNHHYMPKKLTKEQVERMSKKFIPQDDKVYLVTDQCFWKENPPEDYNIFDKNRKPHTIELVEAATGTVVHLPSGSLVKVVHTPN